MEVVKKTSDYTVYQKRSKRYAVKDANNRWVSGDDKIKILLAENLVKAPEPKPKETPPEETAEETPAE
jgi:hypothetical protein